MSIEQFIRLEDALDFLRQKKYVHSFQCSAKGWLCPETNESFGPDDLVLDACQRFGQAQQLTVLYAVTSPTGLKGIIIDNCNTYANILFGELLVRLKLQRD